MASANTSVNLSDHFVTFAKQQVAAGKYGSTSDVVRAGLRLLEEHESKLDALRQALIEGEESGPALPFDVQAFLARKRAERKAG